MIRYKWAELRYDGSGIITLHGGYYISSPMQRFIWEDKKYTVEGRVRLCYNGFHCCRTMKDIYAWSPIIYTIPLLMKVEVDGPHLIGSDKEVWKNCRIKSICVLTKKQQNNFSNYDTNENCIGMKKLKITDFVFLPYKKAIAKAIEMSWRCIETR
jgi:hypothetical protein